MKNTTNDSKVMGGKRTLRPWLCLILFFLALDTPLMASELVVLESSFDRWDIGCAQLEYCVTDPEATIAQAADKQFRPLTNLEHGFPGYKLWVRLTIRNASESSDFSIYQDYPLIDYCNLYFQDYTGEFQEIRSGDQFPIAARGIKTRHIIFPVRQTQLERTYYISFATQGAIHISLSAYNRDVLFHKLLNQDILYSFCYGFVIAVLLYSASLYVFQIKEKDNKYYVWYILLLISYLFTHASMDGLALQYLWPWFPWWANHSICVFAGLMFAAIMQFARSYLKIRDHSVLLDNISIVVIAYVLLFMTGFNFINLRLSFQLANVGGILLGFCLLLVSLYLWLKKKSVDAKVFFITWILFSVSIVTFMLKQMGFLPHNLFTNNSVRIGFTLQSFLLSIALSQKINRMKAELVRLNNMKDDFLANTTHELKTPLHGIIGITECLADKPEMDANTRKDLLSIIYSARRLSNLVNDLLDTTRIKNGTVVLKKIPCELKRAVEITLDLTAPLNRDKQLIIENKIPDGLPCVLADEGRLLQILQNLIENAIKYTSSGGIVIAAEPIQQGAFVECAIKDTGVGIAEKDLDKIFNSFTQGNINNAGSGLGLAITKNLVELHGGHISVTSVEGRSSTFRFALPVTADLNQMQNGRAGIEKIYENPSPVFLKEVNANGNRHHIIAVDDDIMNLKILNNVLVAEGYHVATQTSGLHLAESIKGNEVDLILLDIMMPEVDGFQICKEIRKTYTIEELPILFLTAKNQLADLVRGFELGGNDYITKPFSKDELLSRIDMHLNLKTANRRLKDLRDFSNTIGNTQSMRDLIITAGRYLFMDKMISTVKIFHDGNLIHAYNDSRIPRAMMQLVRSSAKRAFDIAEHDNTLYVYAALESNYVIVCGLARQSDQGYVQNIVGQIRAIQQNIGKLIGNRQVLNSVHLVAGHLTECDYIKGDGKYARLYAGGREFFVEMQLGQIEVYFFNQFHRVHRSYLVNLEKVKNIQKNSKGVYFISFKNGDSIPVGNKYKEPLLEFVSVRK